MQMGKSITTWLISLIPKAVFGVPFCTHSNMVAGPQASPCPPGQPVEQQACHVVLYREPQCALQCSCPHGQSQLPPSSGQGPYLPTWAGLFENPGGTGVLDQEVVTACRFHSTVALLCWVPSMSLHRCLFHETEALFSLQAQREGKNKQIVWDIFVCLETSTMTTCNTSKCRGKYEVSLNIMCHWHSQAHLSERTEQELNKREKLPASIFICRCHLHSPLDRDSLLISSSSHQEHFWRVFLIDGWQVGRHLLHTD